MDNRRRFTQCLNYALDKVATEGGYVLLRKSSHWPVFHVEHMSHDGDITHFVPPGGLKQPWHSMFGFRGVVKDGDDVEPRRMSLFGIQVSIVIVSVLGTAWCLHRTFERLWNGLRRGF